MNRREKIILGVDPGLNTTGYGVLDVSSGRARLLEAGIVRSTGKTLSARIKDIYDGIVEVINTFHPDVLALEQLYSLYKRPETAILMGHARGAICLAAEQSGITLVSYAATKIKKTMTGAGRAPKDQMQRAVQMELQLPTLPEPPDVADAIAIAFCHFTEAIRSSNYHTDNNLVLSSAQELCVAASKHRLRNKNSVFEALASSSSKVCSNGFNL